VITIAHRITTILHCDKFTIPLIDRILVVDRGGIKEFKTTQELLDDKTSTFYGIYQETLKQQQ
jgi:ABC-type multidrug transport system fused ATPase/permease subunit